MRKHHRTGILCFWLSIFLACGLVGCDRLTSSRYSQLMQDADAKSEQGNFERAINLYEAALDDSPRCAEIHYKLALLYDDKLNDPVSALHHFRRCLGKIPSDVMKSRCLRRCLAIPSLLEPRRPDCETKILRSWKSALRCRGARQARRRRATQARKRPTPQNRQNEPTPFSQATRSRRFPGNFTNRRPAGKRFSTQTKKASVIQRS